MLAESVWSGRVHRSCSRFERLKGRDSSNSDAYKNRLDYRSMCWRPDFGCSSFQMPRAETVILAEDEE
jgi:hypothetical protein